jgi:hypothetical protein
MESPFNYKSVRTRSFTFKYAEAEYSLSCPIEKGTLADTGLARYRRGVVAGR